MMATARIARGVGLGVSTAARDHTVSVRGHKLREFLRRATVLSAHAAAVGLVALSAILVKESRTAPPLAAMHNSAPPTAAPTAIPSFAPDAEPSAQARAEEPMIEFEEVAIDPSTLMPEGTRWFHGRPIRPAREMWMTVTAYSPDARSCGDSADGYTATMHSVETNAGKLVAADPRVLRYGSMISVPGYHGGDVVPVLDCGGKIKGSRLDVLYPTHEQARLWGRQRLKITVWEFADGKPAIDPRKLR